ncbi:TraR/DksA family transcriptional regulator [Marisediminicola senii]|uniref:TraR/DksA family transcriptional regulator n=1 Tax=Marisediminicola senii TaxID=2711233 RepID=UPI0013EB2FCD|nr:TraR/DksA C4-type zinc finger protein [Marisediminicola senii]
MDAALRRHERELLRLRAERATGRESLATAMRDVRAARSDGTADDEHDPDGPTLSAESSRISGLTAEAAARDADIEAALTRIADGTFGRCIHCSKPIGEARLDVRPESALCIDCAREAEARRR